MENKTGKYFKYAIGEIVLVVIGILIALSINNWNEDRKLNHEEKVVIENLIEDLQADYDHFKENKIVFEKQLILVDRLIAGSANSRVDKTTSLNILRFGGAMIPIAFEDNIPEEIINKGIIEPIKIYYRDQKSTLNSYEGYVEVVMDMVRPFLRKHGIHNPKSVAETPYETIDNIEMLIEEKLLEQLGSEEFGQILFELRLKTGSIVYDLDNLSIANRKLVHILKTYINDKIL